MKSESRSLRRRLFRLILVLMAMGVLFYGALVGMVCVLEVQTSPVTDYDSILVLGAQVKPDGSLSLQLKWRLDKAIEYYEKQPCPIVCAGAMAGTEPRPEGDVMREYLIAQGLPADEVISDPLSRNTEQNIANGAELLKARGCTRPLIITSDYHLPRALALARDQHLQACGVGSPCRGELIYWAKNHGREALAWVKYGLNKYLGMHL